VREKFKLLLNIALESTRLDAQSMLNDTLWRHYIRT